MASEACRETPRDLDRRQIHLNNAGGPVQVRRLTVIPPYPIQARAKKYETSGPGSSLVTRKVLRATSIMDKKLRHFRAMADQSIGVMRHIKSVYLQNLMRRRTIILQKCGPPNKIDESHGK